VLVASSTEHPTVTGLALRAGLAAKLKSCPSPGKPKAYSLKAAPQDVTGQACGADEVTCSRIDRATDSERQQQVPLFTTEKRGSAASLAMTG
jgi:hypothetical protein